MNRGHLLNVAVVAGIVVVLAMPQRGQAYILYDGGTHEIVTAVTEEVYVRSGATLNIQSSGSINRETGNPNSSQANCIETDTGTVNLRGGNVTAGPCLEGTAMGISLFWASTLNLHDGHITGGHASKGGSVGGVDAYQSSILNIYGGTISGGYVASGSALGLGFNGSTVNIYAGTICGGTVAGYGSATAVGLLGSTLNIYGGIFVQGNTLQGLGDGINVNQSIVTIHGGTIPQVRVDSNSTVTIYGTGFNFGLGPISDRTGTLTGLLEDGTVLNMPFSQYSPGEIVLVPEPATLSLLALGGLAMLLWRKQATLSAAEDK